MQNTIFPFEQLLLMNYQNAFDLVSFYRENIFCIIQNYYRF